MSVSNEAYEKLLNESLCARCERLERVVAAARNLLCDEPQCLGKNEGCDDSSFTFCESIIALDNDNQKGTDNV